MSDLFAGEAKEISLRPYQLDAIEQVREHIRQGKKNIILCAPTGSGKTVIGAHLINESQRKLRHSAFVVDRLTLISQTSEVFDRHGIDHGVVQADHERRAPWKRVQICSAQTVARRKWPDADLLVIDEAHTLVKVVADRIRPRDTITIGLTATPFSRGLGKLYDALVNVTTTDKLIAEGFLSPFRIYSAIEPDMTNVPIVAGEWVDAEASKEALKVVGDVVEEYAKHGEGRKFLCASCDVAHAEELARQFNAAGIRAETYTYKTPDNQRAEIVREFKRENSSIRGLISPVALTKGFDVPSVSCLIMARPLRSSLAEHIQFFGRGLRIHPKKVDCVILDHAGNCKRFAADWLAFFSTGCLELDDGKPKKKPKKKLVEAPPLTKCPQCTRLHAPMPRCPACGHEYPRRVTVAHAAGTLSAWIADGDKAKLTAEVWPQICGYVRQRREGDTARRMALALYRQITGQWPKSEFAQTKSAPLTREVEGRIRQGNVAYARSKKSAKRAIATAQEPVEAMDDGGPPW